MPTIKQFRNTYRHIGRSTDARSSSRLTGRYTEICGEDRRSIFAPFRGEPKRYGSEEAAGMGSQSRDKGWYAKGRHTTDRASEQGLLKETEKILEMWKHPEPFVYPTAPGGMTTSPSFCILIRRVFMLT